MIADALTALADPTRRRVFELVAERPSPVGEIAGQLPVSRPAVSQHLKVLRLAGLWQDFHQARLSIARLGDILNTPTEPTYSATKTALCYNSADGPTGRSLVPFINLLN